MRFRLQVLVSSLVLCSILIFGVCIGYAREEVIEDFEIPELAGLAWNLWTDASAEGGFEIVEESRDPKMSTNSLRLVVRLTGQAGYKLGAMYSDISIVQGAKSLSYWVKLERGKFSEITVSIQQSKGSRVQGYTSANYENLKDGKWHKITIPLVLEEGGVFKWDDNEESSIFFPLLQVFFSVNNLEEETVVYFDDIVVEY